MLIERFKIYMRERRDIEGAVAFRMKEVIPSGPGEVSWGRAVIKLQIVEGEQGRSLGKGSVGGGEGEGRSLL